MRTAVFLIFSFILSPFYFAVIDTTRADGGRATVLTADPTLAIPKFEGLTLRLFNPKTRLWS